MASNPPACPAEKRSLGENLVNDRRMPCSAQVGLCTEPGMWLNVCYEIHLGSAGKPNVCSHCFSVPYMKIPANNQVIFEANSLDRRRQQATDSAMVPVSSAKVTLPPGPGPIRYNGMELSVRLSRFPGIFRRTHGGNGLKFCMLILSCPSFRTDNIIVTVCWFL